ncbi:hypothetical protein GCM10009678_41730 [Actinomadura kijaniata]|uniref:Uncharacterized protein n=1 Tax=Actinomadura namibiensis TaxID=182080 RepID=A0A7W3LM91_ACTNM|nr:CU044_5270 family protein [Actinomadura namibiensis]MBA8950694.1 hypothetical protein [Actinomadura namibiensis]
MPEPLLPETRDMPPGRHQARRAHLLTEIDQSPARRPFPARRALFGGLAGAALVAGAAAVALPPGGTPQPETVPMSATSVLTRAADAAAAQPPLKPRPDQFLYFESRAGHPNGSSLPEGVEPRSTHRRTWWPVDGRRAGLLITTENGATSRSWACGDRARAVNEKIDLDRPPGGCGNRSAHRTDLPTDPAAMRSWLYRNSDGANPPDVQAFITVGDTLQEAYVPSASMAAMFRAAARIPGVTVRRTMVDFAGRRGVAVGQTWGGVRHELIFSARGYRLLGERTVVDRDGSFRPRGGATPEPDGSGGQDPFAKKPDGYVIHEDVTLKVAVVDRLGQEPR